jgi:hypothetical protein
MRPNHDPKVDEQKLTEQRKRAKRERAAEKRRRKTAIIWVQGINSADSSH